MTLSQKKLVISRARKKNKRQKIFITELQLLRVRKIRHSREGGNPQVRNFLKRMDSRLRTSGMTALRRTLYKPVNHNHLSAG
jgi:hypothetical protein